MSRNGSGTYVLPVGNPVVTGTTITSNWANTTFSDVATALTGSVAADGQTPMTGPLAMGNNKITGVANGTASTDVATVGQISNPNITGGSIDGTPIGNISPSTGKFTTLDVSSSTTLAGTCTAPTVTPGSDNSNKIATTEFVQSAISAVSSGVTSFNTRTGVVTLSSGDVTGALGFTPYNAGGNTVVTTGNIATYAPSPTGTGASGNWGINVTGNAATVTNGAYVNAANTFTSTNTFNATYAVQIPATKNLVFGTTSEWTIGWDNSTNLLYNFNATAKVYFTTSGAAYNTTGSWGTISDQRIKQNVTPANKYLDKLCQLNVVNYNLIDDEKKMIGFIAQQVESVMPGLVETSNNTHYNISDFKSLKTSVMIPMLVQAIKELKEEIELLKGAK
jgi:hypothetical protein